jgi:hypothetical protein
VPLVLDGDDQAARLERFRATHPDVPVLLMGTRPRAWVGGQKIEHPTLRGLLDDLEEIFRRDTRVSRPGTPQ